MCCDDALTVHLFLKTVFGVSIAVACSMALARPLPPRAQVVTVVRALLNSGKVDPNAVTIKQMRGLVQEQLAGQDDYDFGDEFKLMMKGILGEEMGRRQVEEERQRKEKEKKKRLAARAVISDDDAAAEDDAAAGLNNDEDNDEEAGEEEEKVRPRPKKPRKAQSTPAPQEKPDPTLSVLKALAQAMGCTPGCYKGFGNMSTEDKIKILRQRLKDKGAKFDDVPTLDHIRRAEARRQKEKDLEGIDQSNIIQGERRRRGEEVVAKRSNKKRPPTPAKTAGGTSSSEAELEFA